jgi:hypothetical protein
MGQIVDTETAKEFMKETLERVDARELAEIAALLERKSAWFQERLSPDGLTRLGPEDLHAVLGRIFSVRRLAPELIQQSGAVNLKLWIQELMSGDGGPDLRFQAFVDRLEGLPQNTRCDLASELLHFTAPERYWLWTRWMWDPKTRTGALPLVITAAYDLQGVSLGEIYLKVGRAVAFVHEVGEAAGFQSISKSILGTDVFLGCVYVVYAYTILRLRMTKEFNKVMPGLPEFAGRLLGVHSWNSARDTAPAKDP